MKKTLTILLFLVALLMLAAPALAYTYDGYTDAEFVALDQTTVIKSADSPTGYVVTFRYVDAEATRVRLYGEWCYSDPADIEVTYQPEEWVPGLVGFSLTYGSNVEMVKDEATGVWSYTVPLPNGLYGYRFYVGGEAEEVTDFTDAAVTWDPANPPTNVETVAGLPALAEQGDDYYISCIYVPFDAEKQTDDYSIMAPRDDEFKGATSFITLSDETVGDQLMTLYTPYSYDVNRAEPYKLLVVFHGAGGFYANWINNGAADNIMDNLIAEGKMDEDTILLMPDGTTLGFSGENFVPFFTETIHPFLQENYNVSAERKDLALSGLSAGSFLTSYITVNNSEVFSSYTMMSGGGAANHSVSNFFVLKDAETDILICNAKNDFLLSWSASDMKAFDLFGIDYTYRESDGGHQWYTWRRDLAYLIENFLWK